MYLAERLAFRSSKVRNSHFSIRWLQLHTAAWAKCQGFDFKEGKTVRWMGWHCSAFEARWVRGNIQDIQDHSPANRWSHTRQTRASPPDPAQTAPAQVKLHLQASTKSCSHFQNSLLKKSSFQTNSWTRWSPEASSNPYHPVIPPTPSQEAVPSARSTAHQYQHVYGWAVGFSCGKKRQITPRWISNLAASVSTSTSWQDKVNSMALVMAKPKQHHLSYCHKIIESLAAPSPLFC